MIPDGLTQGDTAEVEFELSAIGTIKTVAGFVTDCDGDYLTMKVLYPSRTVYYQVNTDADDDEQVSKTDERDNDLGSFGPVLNIMTPKQQP